MNLRSLSIAPILLAAALGGFTLAGEAPGSPAAPVAALQDDSASVLERQRDAWLAETRLSLGAADDGSWIGFGSAELESAPGPGWGAARLAAFERAESEARAAFVELFGLRVTSESVGRLFQDDAAFDELLDASRATGGDLLARIEGRLRELSGEELVRALELLGLDPEDLAAMDEAARRVALSESFRSRVATRAARELRGLRVIQTFEVHGAELHAVGVLVRWSEENARLAEVVRTGKGTIAGEEQGLPLAKWLPQDDESLLDHWGVRVYPGPDGEPLVVCFAQAAVGARPEDPPRARAARRRAAALRARTFALRDLTQFVNATTVVDQVSSRDATYELALKLFPDGFTDQEAGSSALARTLERTIQTHGEAVITGGEVVRDWRATYPGTDVEFCGVVYTWSPTHARLAFDFAGGEASGARETEDDDYPVDF